MAYTDFVVTTIDTDAISKTITINGSYDFDPDCANDKNIILLDKSTRNLVEYSLKISGKKIILTLIQWPVPNKEYILSIQNLKSIIGDEINTGIRRRIYFNSRILSKIKITKPADGEYLNDLIIKWDEIIPDVTHKKEDFIYDSINSYFIEIAEDPAFYKVIKNTTIENRTEVQLSNINRGQYYIRCRAQKDTDYGEWSEIKTFMVSDHNASPDPLFPDEEDIYSPIVEDTLKVVTFPEDNETPESIIIEFDDEIDPESIKDLIVMRRLT